MHDLCGKLGLLTNKQHQQRCFKMMKKIDVNPCADTNDEINYQSLHLLNFVFFVQLFCNCFNVIWTRLPVLLL